MRSNRSTLRFLRTLLHADDAGLAAMCSPATWNRLLSTRSEAGSRSSRIRRAEGRRAAAPEAGRGAEPSQLEPRPHEAG